MTNVLLVGLMGTGKTTIADLIAKETGWPHLDNDVLVRRSAGAALEELRRQVGGDGLHDAESAALHEVLRSPPPWVAGAAASVVMPAQNRAAIRLSGAFVVWLQAHAETLAERISEQESRPWVTVDPVGVLTAMAKERDPLFASISDMVVNVEDVTDEMAAALIVAALKERERHR
ncbi:MAG: shikimate kinase [Candidatus Nanopelagicales bacterium]